ncbi:MAG: 2-amino-4-hydroxy-6-hydroxymethyldihydropteridine pyrophosphokinase, partial [uncultured bacterium]
MNLESAMKLLESYGIKILGKSAFYDTEPWGLEHQANFINMVIKTETDLEPQVLVTLCGEVERQLGRID